MRQSSYRFKFYSSFLSTKVMLYFHRTLACIPSNYAEQWNVYTVQTLVIQSFEILWMAINKLNGSHSTGAHRKYYLVIQHLLSLHTQPNDIILLSVSRKCFIHTLVDRLNGSQVKIDKRRASNWIFPFIRSVWAWR